MLQRSTLLRLETQLEVISSLLGDAPPAVIVARPPSGQWSAHENLAHLARHHAIMLERLLRILKEDAPQLGRYSAEEDPEWLGWSTLPLAEILERLKAQRSELVQLVEGLTPVEIGRRGIHPLFGPMTIADWLEFFLLHEAHHLYLVKLRLGQARATGKA